MGVPEREGPRRHCFYSSLGSVILWDAHFQNNTPGLLAEAPEPSKSQVTGKLDGLIPAPLSVD